MSDSLDEEIGNCKQCGHQFDPHIVIAYDRDDLDKGGELKCPVDGCDCVRALDFKLKDT